LNKKKFLNVSKEELVKQIKSLEEALKIEVKSKAEEEKRHLSTELEELEIRKEMTLKNLESESKVEALEETISTIKSELYNQKRKLANKESEVKQLNEEVNMITRQKDEMSNKVVDIQGQLEKTKDVLKSQKLKFESEYTIFLKKLELFDGSERIQCAFCPQDNQQTISNFIFHIAREHMFDQYKKQDIVKESLDVGMYIKVLEDKAKKKLSSEMTILSNSLNEMKEKVSRCKESDIEKDNDIQKMKYKVAALERDIETLLESEAIYKTQIDNLVVRNNTLQNQVRSSISNESLKIENIEVMQKLEKCERELSIKVNQNNANAYKIECLNLKLKENSAETLKWSARCKELTRETSTLKQTLKGKIDENECLKSAKSQLEEIKKTRESLKSTKEYLENELRVMERQLIFIKEENETLKKSNLREVRDVVCDDDIRMEKNDLLSQLNLTQDEIKYVKAENSKLKISKDYVLGELDLSKKEIISLKEEVTCLKNENELFKQKLRNEMEKIEVLKKEREIKDQSDLLGVPNLPFDMCLDSILKTPLEVINLQIDNIDIDNLEIEDEAIEIVNLSDGVNKDVEEELKNNNKSNENKHNGRDEEFFDDLLNDSLEVSDRDINETPCFEHTKDCECVDCDILRNTQSTSSHQNHPVACDCVDCDDCDVLHGYLGGHPHGIKEMMDKINKTT